MDQKNRQDNNTAYRDSNGQRNNQGKGQAFKLRTVLELDMDLGYELGSLILKSKTVNSALIAIGHQLVGD